MGDLGQTRRSVEFKKIGGKILSDIFFPVQSSKLISKKEGNPFGRVQQKHEIFFFGCWEIGLVCLAVCPGQWLTLLASPPSSLPHFPHFRG